MAKASHTIMAAAIIYGAIPPERFALIYAAKALSLPISNYMSTNAKATQKNYAPIRLGLFH